MNKLPSLFENNREWAKRIKEEQPDFFDVLSKGQNPDYLWIGCADSRVPVNEILDLAPGEIFVHRNIANLVVHSDLNCQSVIQYAVSVLKVKHIIVCGHYGCGGVKAAMEHQSYGLIDNWLFHIKDTYKQHEEVISAIEDEEEKLNKLCELNVHAQVRNVCHSPFVQRAWDINQGLSVHGWVYSLEEGLIKDLNVSISSNKETADLFRIK